MKNFNTTGACIPEKHYMADVSKKIIVIQRMVEAGQRIFLQKNFLREINNRKEYLN